MLEINNNIDLIKTGILQAIKLFKVQYLNNRNVILLQDRQLFVNNVDRILQIAPKFSNRYVEFGFNFVVENIKNFRNNITINPVLYLLSLEILFKNLKSTKDLVVFSNRFEEIKEFITDFYYKSNLSKAKVSSKDIKSNFDINDDTFFNDIIRLSCEDYNILIQDDKENKITIDDYYRLKSNLVSGNLTGKDYKLLVVYNLDKVLYSKLQETAYKYIVICNNIDFNLNKNSSKISVFKVSHKILLSYIYDVIKLANCDNLLYDRYTKFENYVFGNIKSFNFLEGILYLSFKKYRECQNLNKIETFDRYCMMLGKNSTIYCKEEFLEKVRQIVSMVRCMKFDGIFYSEIKTLKILLYYFNKNKDINTFLYKLLYNYLSIFIDNHTEINEIINNNDLKNDFSKINNSKFVPMDLYVNTFALIESNINSLAKVF